MIATGIEVDPRQPKPPRLGAVPPVADLDSACNRWAVLWVRRAVHLNERDGLVLVPLGEGRPQIRVPVASDVVTDAKPEVRIFARPVVRGSGLCHCPGSEPDAHPKVGEQHARHDETDYGPSGEAPAQGANSSMPRAPHGGMDTAQPRSR